MEPRRYYTPLLACLLAACIARLWLPLLTESYWLDETVTAFIARYGIHHPSLAFAPKLDLSLYYWLPRASSEISLRLPSLVATFISLFLIARIAARLIHPQAAWFAVFLCFLPHEFTRLATDARPYGLGTCVALAAMLFLIRWIDHARPVDAALFCLFAALLLRIHLIYWPFYVVYVIYALLAPVSGRALAIAFGIVAASLIPLVPATLALTRQAAMHVVVDKSQATSFLSAFQIPMIFGCALAGWLLSRVFHWPRQRIAATTSTRILIAVWWFLQPVALLAFSSVTGNDVFVARYFSIAVPGMVLAATLALSAFIPSANWKPLTAILATGILIAGFAHGLTPPSRGSDWRGAAHTVNTLIRGAATPVLCPSPFIEAQPPAWTPNYTLPGFFYAHLAAYPIEGDPILLPARLSPEGERYVQPLIKQRIVPAGRFILYSGVYGVYQWLSWLENRPELNPWKKRHISFGDVELIVFER